MTGNFDDLPLFDKSDLSFLNSDLPRSPGARDLPVARQIDPAKPRVPVLTPIEPDAGRPGTGERQAAANPPRLRPVTALMVTMVGFVGMMGVSFGYMAYNLATAAETMLLPEDEIREQMMIETGVFEAVDTAIVVLTLAAAGIPPVRAVAGKRAVVMWAFGVPCLGVLFALNMGYHLTLRALFNPEDVIEIGLADGWWTILLVCVQPAVVEELFFRYMLLGHLRPHIGTHGSVGLTAVLFGMAHLGGFISWPVLMIVGVGLGYARVFSGGLALPILLHFLHNLAVLVVDHAMTH